MYKVDNMRTLLCTSGTPTQYSVVNQMGRKSKKEGMYVDISLSHFAVQ